MFLCARVTQAVDNLVKDADFRMGGFLKRHAPQWPRSPGRQSMYF